MQDMLGMVLMADMAEQARRRRQTEDGFYAEYGHAGCWSRWRLRLQQALAGRDGRQLALHADGDPIDAAWPDPRRTRPCPC